MRQTNAPAQVGQVRAAKQPNQAFIGGLALGRYAGYGSWRVGVIMVGLGSGLVAAINALGG